MTTTTALILPTTVTQADIQAAAYTLGQCLRFNADTLPFRELNEGWNVRLLLDQLAAPGACVPTAPDHADVPSTASTHTAPV